MSRQLLKSVLQRASGEFSAVLSAAGGVRQNLPGILMYHRIAEVPDGLAPPSINVPPDRFESQMVGLQRAGFDFWPLNRLLTAASSGEKVPGKVVVLTFDDGYECIYSNAWPILKRLQIPATIFLNTAYLGTSDPFPFDRWGVANQHTACSSAWRPLSVTQCLEMRDSTWIDLGAHTHTHGDFRDRPDELRSDLELNIQFLRQNFGIDNVPFAFPCGRRHLGQVSDQLIAAAVHAGVTCALTTDCSLVDPAVSPFGWDRFNVYPWDSARTLAARLNGWYGWVPRLQSQLARFSRPTKIGRVVL